MRKILITLFKNNAIEIILIEKDIKTKCLFLINNWVTFKNEIKSINLIKRSTENFCTKLYYKYENILSVKMISKIIAAENSLLKLYNVKT